MWTHSLFGRIFLAKVQFLRNKMKKMLFLHYFYWPYQLPVFWSVLAPIWIKTLFGTKKIIQNNLIFFTWSSISTPKTLKNVVFTLFTKKYGHYLHFGTKMHRLGQKMSSTENILSKRFLRPAPFEKKHVRSPLKK